MYQNGMWYRKWSNCFYDWQKNIFSHLFYPGVCPWWDLPNLADCFCSWHQAYALGTTLILKTSAWETGASTWKCRAGTSQPLLERELVLPLHQNRPVDSQATLAQLPEAWVIRRLFKALLKCVVTLKFYIDHHYMLIITSLLEVWNASDFNQKTCGEHLAKYCQSSD